jgi:glutamine amidotransferase
MIAIIDYGAGNLGSISNMLRKLGQQGVVTSDIEVIRDAEKIILPGVGKFDYGMNKLNESGLVDILSVKAIQEKIPILGICLGAQLMTKSSEEGKLPGLGWFDAEVKKFNFILEEPLRIPHMGWNYVTVNKQNPLIPTLDEEQRFYFVHSYYINSSIPSDVMLTTVYGKEFVSGLANENIFAVQFHPEKSHKYGLNLFNNFLSL